MDEELEKRIREAIEGGSNDLTPSIDRLNSLIAKSWVDQPLSNSSFEEIYKKASSTSVKMFRHKAWYFLAAAVILITPLLFLLRTGKAFKQTTSGSSILVLHLNGKVYLSAAGSKDRLALNEGENVGKGQVLSTDRNSTLSLSVAKGEAMLLESETDLEVVDDQKRTFRLHSGKLLTHIHKNLKKEDFKILTSNGVVEVRGTKFSVTESAEFGTQVSVLEGRVAAIRGNEADKGEQVLEPGQRIRLNSRGFQRSFLTSSELTELSNEFTRLTVEEIPRDTTKSFSTKDELFKEYQRFERVVLTDKSSLEGVIIDMDGDFLYLQTLQKEIRIPRDSVQEVIQVR
ncbi:sigma factor regulatory protein, FecR/PupR family [Leptospira fainei serovar Hurstbridge str. BUT 6]|uniref:Sigma factor regulatory protein, FecR/PupR family n=1 Tax=Leptospira fainei serovar Hurstbridge str. BUT 6 TaxID=1193011 RepID=S3UU67_9LEPT|nr:FecR family protein [Leptospira fainei]EPG72803.1 sigma factor regulatory protein, FecR/PupR family [Leptospira fainei serovar Hurstbridge str. BUT 6]